MKKKLYAFLFIVVLLLNVSCSNKEEEKIVVGMELAYPPFEMTDNDGNPTGISVDMAYDLGKFLGKEIVIENMAFNGLIPALQTGKIDLIISSMTITEKRGEVVNFSKPYASSYLSLLIYKNSPVITMEDLNQKGRKIAVKKGTTGHIYATEYLKDAEVVVFEKESACVLEVSQGRADAFIYDQMTILKNWQANKDTTRAYLLPFQKDVESWGIAIDKENEAMLKEVNEFIDDYRKNEGFDKLAKKYLAEQKKIFDEMDIPFFFK